MTAPLADEGLPARRRMAPEDRRTALLDAAAHIIATEGVAAVSMDAVAAVAGVSRPLVYRYFATSGDILGELYVREMAEVDTELFAQLDEASTFEEKVRTVIRVWLATFGERGKVLGPLLRAEVIATQVEKETAKRNRRFVRHFSRLAVDEWGASQRVAVAGGWMQLAMLGCALQVWDEHPYRYRRSEIASMYVDMVMGGWSQLVAGAAG